MWHDLLWVGRCKVARGEIDEAIEFMTKAVNPWTPRAGLARFAEGVLLHAGHRVEAYEKYALEANRATTYLATYRLVSKKYPEIDVGRLLVGKNPSFSAEVALAALRWICQGRGFELTSLDVQQAYRLASEAGNAVGQSERLALRIQAMLKPATREVRWVRDMLNMPASSEAGSL